MVKPDVKFDLPIYDGELNAEKLDNWIRQIDVYCRLQNIDSDKSKIQLASLCLGGTALVYWEGRTQADMKRHGKTISVWSEFVAVIKKAVLSIGLHATSHDELANSFAVEREKCAKVHSRI